MKLKLRTILLLTLAVASGVFLIYTSQEVQKAESQLRSAERALNHAQDNIRVLGAEWAFLSAPQNLEDLAKEHLNIKAAAPAILDEAILTRPPAATMQDASYRGDAP